MSGDGTGGSPTSRGSVVEVLPNQLYRVTCQDGKIRLCGLAPEARHRVVRLVAGDEVVVKIASHDPGRGRILEKLS